MVVGILREIREWGGLARTAELLRAGYPDEVIRVCARYGVIVHVCHGWWAAPGLDPDVARARQLGGRLACVSAIEHHGQAVIRPLQLHIELGRSGKRPSDTSVVVHWRRRRSPGDRQAVSIEAARGQARVCQQALSGTL